MKVLIAASEAIPYAKTGGLADVMGSLVKELPALKVDARLMLPLYRGIKGRFDLRDTGHAVRVPVGEKRHASRILSLKDRVFFLECDEFFDRQELYGTSRGEYDDNAHRFIFFSRAVLEACKATGFVPDVLHCNDWQTGLVPLYAKTLYRKQFKRTPTLFTIHNLGYQGIFPASAMPLTGLGMEQFTPDILEFYGQLNFLKAGIIASDTVTTVSMNYAKEILTKQYGFGLDGVLRYKAGGITGVLNGIDYGEWDPARDGLIAGNYGPQDFSGKKKCRDALLKECGFSDGRAPVLSMVGRLSSQKGFDVLLAALDRILSLGVNMVILGKGEEAIQKRLREAAKRHPGRLSLNIGYSEPFAHRIYSGSDVILMPSRYEPCGLTQMIALKYATVPVARATGGLADTIEDYNHLEGTGTGFLFWDYGASAFEECLKRALCVYSDEARWRGLAMRGMEKDFSWRASAKRYAALYRALLRRAEG
jgi:starch synthase